MKIFIATILICVMTMILYSQSSDAEQLKNIIMETDKAMSDMAVKEGFIKATHYYADENIVKLNEGVYPIVGKKQYEEFYGDRTGSKSITWEPLYAEVAKSGELGYTWGNWKFIQKDTTLYGNYFTVWKKQKDGSWKVALDGGNTTPPPK